MILALLTVNPQVHATPTITESYISIGYSSTNQPDEIVTGSDGALWFKNGSGSFSLGRLTTAGVYTAYTPSISGPYLTKDSNGDMWASSCDANQISKVNTDGTISAAYAIPAGYTCPRNISGDANSNLWFVDQNSTDGSWIFVAKMSQSGSFTTYNISDYGYDVGNFASGSDGNVWFAMTKSGSTPKIAKIDASGIITKYTSPCGSSRIAAGPDGALWYTCGNYIGRITTGGVITTFALAPNSYPGYITQGPDGAMWFTQSNTGGTYGGSIGRISMNGTISVYPLTSTSSPSPRGITTGPDGALWFAESSANRIGRITIPYPSTPTNLTLAAPVTNGSASLSWDASDASTSYDVYRDGVKIGNVSQTHYYDSGLAEGSYSYYVEGVNSSGTSAASNTVALTVDKTGPVVQVDSPADGATVSGTATFTGSVTDPHLDYYTYYLNNDSSVGIPSVTVWASKNNETIASINTTAVANGNYHLTFVARDIAGNYSVTERQITIAN